MSRSHPSSNRSWRMEAARTECSCGWDRQLRSTWTNRRCTLINRSPQMVSFLTTLICSLFCASPSSATSRSIQNSCRRSIVFIWWPMSGCLRELRLKRSSRERSKRLSWWIVLRNKTFHWATSLALPTIRSFAANQVSWMTVQLKVSLLPQISSQTVSFWCTF